MASSDIELEDTSIEASDACPIPKSEDGPSV